MFKRLDKKENKFRKEKILNFIPKDVEKVFDIGSRFNMFKNYDLITLDIEGEPDILQDLNKNQKLPLKDNSVDIVILSQVLEHLADPRELIEEAKRISKKYIFIGLPNELTYSDRYRYFFGINRSGGFNLYGHKHFFTPKESDRFVNQEIGRPIKKGYRFGGTGGYFFPKSLKNLLAKNFPSLFAIELHYLIKVKK